MTAQSTKQTSPASLLLFAGAAVALSHLADQWLNLEQPWGPVWKASGIVLLGLYAFSQRAPLAGLGLLFSAAGDVLLELDGLFVFGMAAFGVAHVFYSICFANLIRRDGPNIAGWPFAVCVLAISIVLAVWMAPGMGALLAPALIYQVVISIMVILALLSKAPLAARIGAILFMLSDTLIAVGMFRDIDTLPGSVWITYAAAQILLAWGLTRPPED